MQNLRITRANDHEKPGFPVTVASPQSWIPGDSSMAGAARADSQGHPCTTQPSLWSCGSRTSSYG